MLLLNLWDFCTMYFMIFISTPNSSHILPYPPTHPTSYSHSVFAPNPVCVGWLHTDLLRSVISIPSVCRPTEEHWLSLLYQHSDANGSSSRKETPPPVLHDEMLSGLSLWRSYMSCHCLYICPSAPLCAGNMAFLDSSTTSGPYNLSSSFPA